MMEISPATAALLARLDTFSGKKLRRPNDLSLVLECGASPEGKARLAELGFRAKFLTKTFALMQRIGPQGEGYDRLAAEFTRVLNESRTAVRALLAGAPSDVSVRFEETILAMTPEAFDNTLALLHDLAWYKNWLLDTE